MGAPAGRVARDVAAGKYTLPMLNRRRQHDFAEEGPSWNAEVQTVNSERIALLVQQHGAGVFTAEDQERLESLTARMLQLVPSVTEKDWKILREIGRRSAKTEALLCEIGKKYGLDETG
jgi:hypothetical protein